MRNAIYLRASKFSECRTQPATHAQCLRRLDQAHRGNGDDDEGHAPKHLRKFVPLGEENSTIDGGMVNIRIFF